MSYEHSIGGVPSRYMGWVGIQCISWNGIGRQPSQIDLQPLRARVCYYEYSTEQSKLQCILHDFHVTTSCLTVRQWCFSSINFEQQMYGDTLGTLTTLLLVHSDTGEFVSNIPLAASFFKQFRLLNFIPTSTTSVRVGMPVTPGTT